MRFQLILFIISLSFCSSCNQATRKSYAVHDTIISDTIQYHLVRLDQNSRILPWYSSDLGDSYDTVISLVWDFWKNMEIDSNGLKYYMNHQVWKPEHDMRGIGGDQISMALSSWSLLYQYTGDPSVIENMKYLADEYISRSLSDHSCLWPDLPYPYNTEIHSGKYDGDMRNGKGFLQPDKAGNFGYELVTLYKIIGDNKYLKAATRIAKVLAEKTMPGDNDNSPLPFRVNAITGKPGSFFSNTGSGQIESQAVYTANWTGTLMLFKEMISFDSLNAALYQNSFDLILSWMKDYPMKTNKWGPFFEDIPGWSNTQTNAITLAMFIMQNRDLFPDWQNDVKGIFNWTYQELANHEYEKYGVTVMNEQTVYRVPGNSHSSRQASMELLYTVLSGDTTYKTNAIRTLNWATYTVDNDGKNRYIRDDIWLTDGYGDYVRHYLRAMAACPELSPSHKNKLLYSTSVITDVKYSPDLISYKTYDAMAKEILRLSDKPDKIFSGERKLAEKNDETRDGWNWTSLNKGGVVQIHHTKSNQIIIHIK
jgi:hypothetical protein